MAGERCASPVYKYYKNLILVVNKIIELKYKIIKKGKFMSHNRTRAIKIQK